MFSSLDNDLHEILVDASDSCEYTAFVDKDGVTQIKIQCTITEEEKQHAWTQLRLKHATDCSLSAEPSGYQPIMRSQTLILLLLTRFQWMTKFRLKFMDNFGFISNYSR